MEAKRKKSGMCSWVGIRNLLCRGLLCVMMATATSIQALSKEESYQEGQKQKIDMIIMDRVGPAIRKLENEKYSDQNAEAVRQRLADIKTYGDDYYQDWIRKLEQEMIPKRRLKDKQESTQEAIQAVQTAVQAAMNAYKNNPNQENRVAARKALTEAAAALDAAPYTD